MLLQHSGPWSQLCTCVKGCFSCSLTSFSSVITNGRRYMHMGPGGDPWPSTSCWQTLPFTPREEATIKLTRIGERLLDERALLAVNQLSHAYPPPLSQYPFTIDSQSRPFFTTHLISTLAILYICALVIGYVQIATTGRNPRKTAAEEHGAVYQYL